MKARFLQLAQNLGVILGAAAVVYGLWLAWRPLAFILGGLLLAAGCFLSGYDHERRVALAQVRERNGGRG